MRFFFHNVEKTLWHPVNSRKQNSSSHIERLELIMPLREVYMQEGHLHLRKKMR